MKYVTNIVETVAILCFAPFIFGWGLMRFIASAVLLIGLQLLNVWTE